jgi:hypothetical protein
VIDKLNSMSKTLEQAQRKAEELFEQELSQKEIDVATFK